VSTPATGDTHPDHSRSGQDVAEAIGVAEQGSSVEEVHDRGTEARSGEAPVEQAAGDPAMTGGQVVHGSGSGGPGEDGDVAAHGTAPAATPETSGVAQSVPAGRPIDAAATDPAGS
jgi:hypothetical protein